MTQTDAIDPRAVVQQWVDAAMTGGQKDPYGSKRQHTRYVWDQPMELWAGDNILYAYSRNISEDGIGLVCKQRLREGERVHVRRDESDPWIQARVAHVTQTVGTFKIGVQLKFEF